MLIHLVSPLNQLVCGSNLIRVPEPCHSFAGGLSWGEAMV